MMDNFIQWTRKRSSIWIMFSIVIVCLINFALVYYGRAYDFGMFTKEDKLSLFEEFIIVTVGEFLILGIPAAIIIEEY